MALHRYIAALWCIQMLFACVAPIAGYAQQGITIDSIYTYRPAPISGIAWQNREYDDSDWIQVESHLFPHESWNGKGYFRFSVAVDSTLQDTPLFLSLTYAGYVEVFVDGQKVTTLSSPTSSSRVRTNAIRTVPAAYPITFSADSAYGHSSKHLVALEYDAIKKRLKGIVGF